MLFLKLQKLARTQRNFRFQESSAIAGSFTNKIIISASGYGFAKGHFREILSTWQITLILGEKSIKSGKDGVSLYLPTSTIRGTYSIMSFDLFIRIHLKVVGVNY